MENLKKISNFEACSLIIMITINQILFNLPSIIIMNIGSSAWINVIYVAILVLLFFLIIYKFFKPFPAQDIIDISEYLGKKPLKIIIAILYIAFFILISSMFLRYLSHSLKLIYFKKTPLVFLLFLFLMPVVLASKSGIKAIARVNIILTPILLFSIIVIFFATIKNFVPQRIFPILGFGAKQTFITGLNNIFTFDSLAYLYFLVPLLKRPEDFKKIGVISIIISAIYLFLSIICLIMVFPFIPFSDEMLSIHLLAGLIKFGKFLQRIDATFILIWILSTFSFLSITVGLINKIIKKVVQLKDNNQLSYSIVAIIFSNALLFNNIAEMKQLQNNLLRNFMIILVFVLSSIILILANIKLKKEKKQ